MQDELIEQVALTEDRVRETAAQEVGERTDRELLIAFATRNDERAFAELVERHVSWVYAAAFRQLRDAHLAEDAVQAVFLLLSRQAAQIGHKKVSGWLFLAVQYTVRSMKREARRRVIHEARAALERGLERGLQRGPDAGATPHGPAASEALDGAVARLGERDRAVIILRFYRGMEFNQVAGELGLSEYAARKRVNRAVGRLRRRLGATLSVAGVVSAAAYGVPAAKGAMAAQVVQGVMAAKGGAAASAGVLAAAKGAHVLMVGAKIKMAVAASCLALFALVSTAAAVWELKQWEENEAAQDRPQVVANMGKSAAPISVATADDPYTLKPGEVFRRVPPPFVAARRAFFKDIDPAFSPAAMRVVWHTDAAGGAPRWTLDYISQLSNGRQGYPIFETVIEALHVPPFDVEGTTPLRFVTLPGDYVVRGGAPREALLAAIERSFREAGVPVTLSVRRVPRTVSVLEGTWHYQADAPPAGTADAAAAGGGAADASVPHLELYADAMSRGSQASGSMAAFTDTFSRWLGRPVEINAMGTPEMVSWRMTFDANRTPAFVQGVLDRVSRQTGLSLREETRDVERIFVESAP